MKKEEIADILKSTLPPLCGVKIKRRDLAGGRAYYLEALNLENRAFAKFWITEKLINRVETESLKRIFAKGVAIYEKRTNQENRNPYN